MFGVKAWMKAKRSGGGTAHLLATWGIAWFVALACTVLIGLEVSRIVTQRSTVIANARLQTANLTRSLLQHAELTFRTADAILIGVVERLEHEKLGGDARERLKAWFAREVKNSAQFTAFGVLDEHGTMVVNLLGENAPAQFADREYFLYHRSHNDDALRIGRPVRSQSSGWLIPVTRRFNKPDGTFGGVALAAINPRYFQDFYDRLELVDNSAVILVSTDGTLLVRRPFVEANVGRDMTGSVIFAQLKKAPAGSLEIKATIDGVTRFNSYEQGQTYPIFVAVAQNMDELLAPWKANAIRRLIETAAITCFILLMGAFVWRATKNLAGNSIELRKTNARFDAALANMPTGLSMFDADGRLIVCNERYIELYGMSADLVNRGANICDIVAHRKQTSGLDMDCKSLCRRIPQRSEQDRQKCKNLALGRRARDVGHQYGDLWRRMDRDPRRHHRARRRRAGAFQSGRRACADQSAVRCGAQPHDTGTVHVRREQAACRLEQTLCRAARSAAGIA